MFKKLKNLPIPTHLPLLLDMLCSWHLNWKLVSDVFLNRIDLLPARCSWFSSCQTQWGIYTVSSPGLQA